jgi:hypothetical protein
MSAMFIAGAAGAEEDTGKRNYAGAECWELLNMRNASQISAIGTIEMSTTDYCSLNFNLENGLRSPM